MNEKLRGITVPAVTPFDAEGNVSVAMMEVNFAKWTSTGIKGIMILGSNGEFKALSDDESIIVVENAVRLKGDKTLIVGVGRESLHHTLEFIGRIKKYSDGIDFISVLTPHYFARKMTGEALYEYFRAVADFSPIPVLLYVAPSYANGVVIPPATLAKLADHPNIAGIKDTSKDQLTSYMVHAGGRDDFDVMSGSLGTIMTDLLFGGPGGVVSAADYFPAECAHLTDLYFAGKTDECIAYYKDLQKLVGKTGGKSGIASVKATMNLLGFDAGVPRLPVQPLDAAEVEKIRAALIEAGKIK